MKNYRLLLFLLLSFLAAQSFGSSWYEVNNGGDAVVCHSDPGSSVPAGTYLLDYFETIYNYKLKPDSPSVSEDPREMARELILRLPESWAGLDSTLRFIDTFYDQAHFEMDYALPDIRDTGPSNLPQNCSLRQLAIQHCSKYQEHRLCYSVDGGLWQSLTLEQQAATIVHEALYRDSLIPAYRAYSASPLRHFVALLISNQARVISEETLRQAAVAAGLSSLRYQH